MKKIIRARALAGVAVALSVAATAAPAMVGGSGANAATPAPSGPATIPFHQKFSANMHGQLFTVQGSVGNALFGNLFSGEVALGKSEMSVNSRGITRLDGTTESVPTGTIAGLRWDLANAAIAGQGFDLGHGISTAPSASGVSGSQSLASLGVPPFFNASIASIQTRAHWRTSYLLKKRTSRELVGGYGTLGTLKVLDMSQLAGPLSALLPSQLRGGLLSVMTPALSGSIKTIRNLDGTHGLRASGHGRFAEVNLLGGAQAGGLTLGLGTADSGADNPAGSVTLWATGKPGGAGCSYVRPSVLKVAFGNTNLELPLSVGSRINLPGGFGYIDYDFLGLAHCDASPDGTSVTASGGGLGVHVKLQIPGLGEIASLQITLPDLDAGSVHVPKGGIKGADWDSDHDGLPDLKETGVYHTNPHRKDTDRDGLPDGKEVKKYHTNPRKKDTDHDGLTDGKEVRKYHTNPRKKDTDHDGLTDGKEVKKYHTNPRKKDTDHDGVPDGVEVRHHTNPRNPRSH